LKEQKWPEAGYCDEKEARNAVRHLILCDGGDGGGDVYEQRMWFVQEER
jgi:hypothetical protein